MESVDNRDWMTREEAEAFIGNNASFYLEKWKSHYDTALKGWNWAAMFFGIEWMVYRKMYWEALVFFMSGFCLSIVFSLLLPGIGGDLFGHAFRILIGVFGNALYRKKAMRVLHKLDRLDDSRRLAELSRRGGGSPISVIVLFVLEVAYVLLLSGR